MKNEILLLKTLLLSTSGRNIMKYGRDKKKRRKILWGMIGTGILYALLIGVCAVMCFGYGTFGLIDSAPVLCALMISAMAFIFTLFKTNGYLFNFREYDMLMSLPFASKTVAGCKFLYMYVKSLPWYLCISLAMLAGYGWFARPHFLIYPVWILLSFFLPVIPMLAASFLGFLAARISAGFRKTNIVQTVLSFTFALLCFFMRFFIEKLIKDDQVEMMLSRVSDATDSAAGFYFPARWFARAVTKGSPPDILLLVGVSALLFAVVFRIVGSSYRNINSALKSHAAAKKYKMTAQRQSSVLHAIAFKELKRMTGSTVYMTNGAMGFVLAVLIGVLVLVLGLDRIVSTVTNGAPIDTGMLQPAIPFIVYFFTGMYATTASSPSLEGKNYWIVQSLPIEKKTLYRGKMLFNMCLGVPSMIISTICLCISAKVPLPNAALYLILGFALCAFSTAWGCVCGIRHMRLDWENDVEVVKQGAAVTIYILPNLFVAMGLVVLAVILGMRMDHRLLALAAILLVSALAALCYRWVMALAKE